MASYGSGPGPGLVLLLLGEKQSGKSSAGNAILHRAAFPQDTSRSCRETSSVNGYQVTVVDTPGWWSSSPTPPSVTMEISRGLALSRPGPHAFLLVLPVSSRLSPEEWEAMETQISQLETFSWQQAIVLFTHGDQLGRMSIQEHVGWQGGGLGWLLDRCGNRYQVMSSYSAESQAQVLELLQKIQRMVDGPRMAPLRAQVSVSRDLSWRGEQRFHIREEMDGIPGGNLQRTPTRGGGGWNPGLSLILLGRRKSGKSSAGNMILSRDQFQRGVKTTGCSAGHAQVQGRSVTVVDTPGWSLFGLAHAKQVRSAMLESASLCPAGSRTAFLLAVPVDSFTEKDRSAVEAYLGVLGGHVWSSTVVLFTYADRLKGRTVEMFVEKRGEALRWVLDMCGWRYHVCDGETGVARLLEMVETL